MDEQTSARGIKLDDLAICPQCLWEDLLKSRCDDPLTATRIVMLSKTAFINTVLKMTGKCSHRSPPVE